MGVCASAMSGHGPETQNTGLFFPSGEPESIHLRNVGLRPAAPGARVTGCVRGVAWGQCFDRKRTTDVFSQWVSQWFRGVEFKTGPWHLEHVQCAPTFYNVKSAILHFMLALPKDDLW